MIRFSETSKWDDAWFRALSCPSKLLFLFIVDRCDNAGFLEIDPPAMAFHTGLACDKISTIIKGINKSLIQKSDIIWVRNFLRYQKNLPLNPLNNSHKKIISLIQQRPEFEEARLLIEEAETPSEIRAKISQKEAVWIRDNGICKYCNEEIDSLPNYELDHIVPRAAHISEVYTNFATACLPCNQKKRDKRVDLTVLDYSSSEAKRDLFRNPTLMVRFNKFFNRQMAIKGNSVIELGAYISPIGIGNVKDKSSNAVIQEISITAEKALIGDKWMPQELRGNEEFQTEWVEWMAHCAEKGSPLTKGSRTSTLAQCARDPKRAIIVLKHARQKNWKSLVWDFDKGNGNGTNKNGSSESTRNIGTANEGRSHLYAGVGKTPKPQNGV